MSDQETDHALESLKLSRDAVKEFDNATRSIRHLFVTLVIGLMTITGIILAFPDFTDKVTFMYVVATVVVVIAILFWSLENRYRTYLRVAAAVSRELERGLRSKQKIPWISTELDAYDIAEKKPLYQRPMAIGVEHGFQRFIATPYDALYLIISLGSIVFLGLISYDGGYLFDIKNSIWVSLLMMLLVIFWWLIRWNDVMIDNYIKEKFKGKDIKK